MCFECKGRLSTAFTCCKSVHCIHNSQELDRATGRCGIDVRQHCKPCVHAARVCSEDITADKLNKVIGRCV